MKVVKRDGSIEEFEIEKIKRVVKAAGLNKKQTKKLADEVLKWVKEQEKDLLPTSEVRKRVYEELKKLDEYAAGLYKWYKKTHHENNSK